MEERVEVAFNPAEYVTVNEAAALLGVHPDVVREELRAQELPVLTIGIRKVMHRDIFSVLEMGYRRERSAVVASSARG